MSIQIVVQNTTKIRRIKPTKNNSINEEYIDPKCCVKKVATKKQKKY